MREKTKVTCPSCEEVTVVEHSTYEAVEYCAICGGKVNPEDIETVED